jgi:two-component system, chemotaxis family, chemotaxis protein CheY
MIVMTTALSDIKTVFKSYELLCDGYLVKPIRKADLVKELVRLDLYRLRRQQGSVHEAFPG